jgi:hypothetical protein
MEILEYAYDDMYIRLHDDVIEVFRRGVEGSYRTPLRWAGVEFTPRKNDQFRIGVGQRTDDGKPFYSAVLGSSRFWFEIPASEQPRVRAFFDEVARRATLPD